MGAGALGRQASGRERACGRERTRGAQAGRRQPARQAQQVQAGHRRGQRRGRAGRGARGARGAGPGHACARRLGVLASQLGQVGARCTWLSFDSVFDRFDSVLFLSHEMNNVHCKIIFFKKKIY